MRSDCSRGGAGRQSSREIVGSSPRRSILDVIVSGHVFGDHRHLHVVLLRQDEGGREPNDPSPGEQDTLASRDKREGQLVRAWVGGGGRGGSAMGKDPGFPYPRTTTGIFPDMWSMLMSLAQMSLAQMSLAAGCSARMRARRVCTEARGMEIDRVRALRADSFWCMLRPAPSQPSRGSHASMLPGASRTRDESPAAASHGDARAEEIRQGRMDRRWASTRSQEADAEELGESLTDLSVHHHTHYSNHSSPVPSRRSPPLPHSPKSERSWRVIPTLRPAALHLTPSPPCQQPARPLLHHHEHGYLSTSPTAAPDRTRAESPHSQDAQVEHTSI